MKRFFSILSLIVLLFSSCAYQLEPAKKEARTLYYHHIQSVLVVPFIDLTKTPNLSKDVTTAFTEEVGRFAEVGVIHTKTVYDYLAKNQITLTEDNLVQVGQDIAEQFGVESMIIGTVTEYDPYFPPILGISYELIDLKSNEILVGISETYDASFNFVRERLDQYSGLKETEDSAYGSERVLRKMDLYIHFVVHELVRRYL